MRDFFLIIYGGVTIFLSLIIIGVFDHRKEIKISAPTGYVITCGDRTTVAAEDGCRVDSIHRTWEDNNHWYPDLTLNDESEISDTTINAHPIYICIYIRKK